MQLIPYRQITALRLLFLLLAGVLVAPAASGQTLTGSTSAIDYGYVPVNGTVSQLVTLTNTSATGPLTITEVAFFGSDSLEFGYLFPDHNPFTSITVPPNGTVDVYLNFTPAAGGDQNAMVEFVYTSFVPGPSVFINLTGNGCANFDPGTPGDPYVESGGKITIEVESQAPTDQWVSYTYMMGDTTHMNIDTITTPDTVIYDTNGVETAPYDMTIYTWEGNNNTGWTGSGHITYAFTINDVSEPYRLLMSSDNHPDSVSTAANDVWFYFNDPGVVVQLEDPNMPLPPPHENVTVVPVQSEWFKAFNSVGGWTWFTNGAVNKNGEWFEGFTNIEVYFPSPGTYSFTIAGRATGFSIDKIALWQNGFPGGNEPESGTAPPPPCPTIWFQDADGDGYGNELATAAAISQPGGYVDNSLDCDDNEPTTHPFAPELDGDNVDNNCDGYVNEGFATTEGCLMLRINTGSEAATYTTPGGEVYGLDLGYTNSPTKDDYTGSAPPIANTPFDALYHTQRSTIHSAEDPMGPDTLNYNVNVGDQGHFLVKLHFAEMFWDFTGQRVFDIVMEEGTAGQISIAGFDILAQSGGAKHSAVVLSQVVTINDSVLNLSLRPTANKPVLAGLEILPLSGCGQDGTVFPVEWLGFEAVRDGNRIALNWQTANEVNNQFFTIERATDGLHFSTLSQVATKGNGNQVQSYQFHDESPVHGMNYYRIKQTDVDGNFSYSQTVEVAFLNTSVTVFPNPLRSHQELVVAFDLQNRDQIRLELTNALGQTLAHHAATYASGSHRYTFSFDQLGQGYYFLKIISQEGTQIRKIAVSE